MYGRFNARRSLAVASLGLTAVACLVIGVAPTAMAAPAPAPPSGGTLVIKAQPTPGFVTPDASAGIKDGVYTVHSASSSASQHISNSFSTKVTLANAVTYIKINSGTATTTWTGAGTGTVDIDNHYWVTGASVTVSVPIGTSGSVFNEAVDYRGHQTARKTTTDTNSGAVWTGLLFSFNENMTGSWSVAGNSYHLTTN